VEESISSEKKECGDSKESNECGCSITYECSSIPSVESIGGGREEETESSAKKKSIDDQAKNNLKEKKKNQNELGVD
jgi:hypothetical protein